LLLFLFYIHLSKIEIHLQPKSETEQTIFISKTQINSWMDWMNRKKILKY